MTQSWWIIIQLSCNRYSMFSCYIFGSFCQVYTYVPVVFAQSTNKMLHKMKRGYIKRNGVNPLRPGGTYMRQWSGSMLIQVFVPNRWQAITWIKNHLLSIGPLRPNFSEILIKMQQFSSWYVHWVVCKMVAMSFRTQCVELIGGCYNCLVPALPAIDQRYNHCANTHNENTGRSSSIIIPKTTWVT